MTLDEAIKHCEEVAEELEKEAQEWHENQVRKCELISFAEMDYTHENECKECAFEHKQLAEWLKELKQLREQTRWIPISERQPNEGGDYFVTTLIDVGGKEPARETRKNFFCILSKEWLYDNDFVVAWQSLPKSYKAEN